LRIQKCPIQKPGVFVHDQEASIITKLAEKLGKKGFISSIKPPKTEYYVNAKIIILPSTYRNQLTGYTTQISTSLTQSIKKRRNKTTKT
jgi:hypothetical protein